MNAESITSNVENSMRLRRIIASPTRSEYTTLNTEAWKLLYIPQENPRSEWRQEFLNFIAS